MREWGESVLFYSLISREKRERERMDQDKIRDRGSIKKPSADEKVVAVQTLHENIRK